ncbi:MAG: hypothetical protein OER86_12315, partial [Phycisphaerae bacterium]|nr:hypothetical protein [Phycisphaerae bacterium]
LATVDPDPGLELEGSAGAVIDSPRNTAALAEAMFALARSAERTACAQAAVRLGHAVGLSRHLDQLVQLVERFDTS